MNQVQPGPQSLSNWTAPATSEPRFGLISPQPEFGDFVQQAAGAPLGLDGLRSLRGRSP